MRAIVIDPFDRELKAVNIAPKFSDYYRVMSGTSGVVTMIQRAPVVIPGIDLWVDEEGLFKNSSPSFFIIGCRTPFFGKGLLVEENEKDLIGKIEEYGKIVMWSPYVTRST